MEYNIVFNNSKAFSSAEELLDICELEHYSIPGNKMVVNRSGLSLLDAAGIDFSEI